MYVSQQESKVGICMFEAIYVTRRALEMVKNMQNTSTQVLNDIFLSAALKKIVQGKNK